MQKLTFKHPEPLHQKTRIWPVFMPFMGCPVRCTYCSQEQQTGSKIKALNETYQEIKRSIQAFFTQKSPAPMEIAFFGGTFTAIPYEWQLKFIRLAAQFKKKGWLTAIRFSTRPDYIDINRLAELKEIGLDRVELGIQTFNPKALKRSARTYSPQEAMDACSKVKECGLSLVIQLLPGLPGSMDNDFVQDVEKTISLGPEAVRIYPCITVKGTALEKLYRAGKYTPWSMERTENEIAPALLKFWQSGIHVIRIGVAQEKEFEKNIVAGPYHPALGQIVRSRALYLIVRSQITNNGFAKPELAIPHKFSGELWGHKGSLKKDYSLLGITPENISFRDEDFFSIVNFNDTL